MLGVYQSRISRYRTSFDRLLRFSPTQPLFGLAARRDLAVLAYHGISDPDAFDAQLGYLKRRSHPVSLDEVLKAVRTGARLPRRSVLLTFDDGDPSLLEPGLPALRHAGIPAVAFVVAGAIGTTDPLWFDAAKELIAAGAVIAELAGLTGEEAVEKLKLLADSERRALMEKLRHASDSVYPRPARMQLRAEDLLRLEHQGVAIGNHTMTHPCLDRCDPAVIQTEVVGAHGRLTEMLGHEPLAFAYPNGNWNGAVTDCVGRTGYELAFVFDHSLCPWPPPAPLAVSRLKGDAADEIDRLAISLTGLHPAVTRVRAPRGRRKTVATP